MAQRARPIFYANHTNNCNLLFNLILSFAVIMVQSTTLPGGDDGNPVMYEELAEVEKKFEDVDIWLSRLIGLID